MRKTLWWVLDLSGAETPSPSGFSSFFFNKHVLLWEVGGGGFLDNWDPVSQDIFPQLSHGTLTYEAERTLDLPT